MRERKRERERERERDNKIPQQRITEKLKRKLDGKRMQDLYIHIMVSIEHIIWLRKMKMKDKNDQREKLINTHRISKEFDILQTQTEKKYSLRKNKKYNNNNQIVNSYK